MPARAARKGQVNDPQDEVEDQLPEPSGSRCEAAQDDKAIGPVRLAVREAIQGKVSAGRTHLEVDEITKLALHNLIENGSWHSELGKLAYDQLKVVVRQELGRKTTEDSPEFYSEGRGSNTRTYVVAHAAQEATLRDNVEMRNAQVAALKNRLSQVEDILAYVETNGGTAEQAVLALHPEAETQMVEDLLNALEMALAVSVPVASE